MTRHPYSRAERLRIKKKYDAEKEKQERAKKHKLAKSSLQEQETYNDLRESLREDGKS